ncbi:MAG: hypothetical protein WCA10_24965 [Terracidiphilus sp.]
MSMFAFRKPVSFTPARGALVTLRETLKSLEAAPVETKQIADLKRILAGRIAEMERKTA